MLTPRGPSCAGRNQTRKVLHFIKDPAGDPAELYSLSSHSITSLLPPAYVITCKTLTGGGEDHEN
ncbi:hypothetical protein EYF80_058607 [Liparis tanakae]|uniref:Uncharacterized protein n=1 Tax=Liparis tanakae TaxID=230148 RepID=A0A4Z2ERM5_9TELE|nr:hypothetical protein EYF80_058607 [Liparis tanakae]